MSTTTAFWTMVTDTTKVAGQTLVYPVTITAIDDKPVATVPILGATTSTILPGTSSTSSTSSVNSALVTPPYPSQNSSSTSTSLTDSTPPQTSITASIAISSGTTSWTLIPYSTTLTAPWQSGQVLSGEVNATVPITKKVSGGISTGATAGIAIATALAGALIAAAVFFMVSKRHKSHRPRQQHEPATLIADRPRNEKSVVQAYTASNQDDDFDLDRLLPQPLDDSGVKREAEKLFSQIDAHVDSFYTDSSTSLSPHLNRNTAQALEHPASRFFMAKRLICSDVLESISPKCTSDRSLLPRGYTSMARMMREPDVDDRGKSILQLHMPHQTYASSNYSVLVTIQDIVAVLVAAGFQLRSRSSSRGGIHSDKEAR